MNDMTMMTTAHPRRVRPQHPSTTARPQAAPASVLVLLPHWRVDAPAPAPVTVADAREGRLRALAAKAARRAAAFQPVEVVFANADFRARVELIAARRVVTASTATHTMPLAAG
jgi:hypothetical protein